MSDQDSDSNGIQFSLLNSDAFNSRVGYSAIQSEGAGSVAGGKEFLQECEEEVEAKKEGTGMSATIYEPEHEEGADYAFRRQRQADKITGLVLDVESTYEAAPDAEVSDVPTVPGPDELMEVFPRAAWVWSSFNHGVHRWETDHDGFKLLKSSPAHPRYHVVWWLKEPLERGDDESHREFAQRYADLWHYVTEYLDGHFDSEGWYDEGASDITRLMWLPRPQNPDADQPPFHNVYDEEPMLDVEELPGGAALSEVSERRQSNQQPQKNPNNTTARDPEKLIKDHTMVHPSGADGKIEWPGRPEQRSEGTTDGYAIYNNAPYTSALKLVPTSKWDQMLTCANECTGHRSLFSYDVDEWISWLTDGPPMTHKTGVPRLGSHPDEEPYDAKEIVLDVDGKTCGDVAYPTRRFSEWLSGYGIPHRLQCTGGRGYHIAIPKGVIGYEASRGLSEHMTRFVSDLAKLFEQECPGFKLKQFLDFGLYSRGHKIRLPQCPREAHGQTVYKREIQPSDIRPETKWGFELCMKGCGTVTTWDDVGPVAMLQRLWEESAEDRTPVEVLKPRGGVGYEEKGSGEILNLDQLTEQIESLSTVQETTDIKGNRKIQLSCIHPEHQDMNPSAAYWPSTGGYNCLASCCGVSKGPGWVAEQMGVELVWDEPDEDQPEDDGPASLGEARREVDRRMRGALYGRRHAIFDVPCGVGKTYTAKELAEEECPVAVVEAGEDARALDPCLVPDGADPEDLSKDPSDHDQLPDWCIDAEWIDWTGLSDRNVCFAVDSYDLSEQVIEEMEDALGLKRPWDAEPRCKNTEAGPGMDATYRAAEIEKRQDLHEARESVCASCPLNPESKAWQEEDHDRDPCQFQVLYHHMMRRVDPSFIAKSYLRIPGRFEELTAEHDTLVVDEDIIPHLADVETFDVSKLAEAEGLGDKVPHVRSERGAVGAWDIIERLCDGQIPQQYEDGDPGVQVVDTWFNSADFADTSTRPNADMDPDHWSEDDWVANDDDRFWKIKDEVIGEDVGFNDSVVEHLDEVTRLMNYLSGNRILAAEAHAGTLYLCSVVGLEHLHDCQILVLDASVTDEDHQILDWLSREVPAYTDEEWEAERERRIMQRQEEWRRNNGIVVGTETDDFPTFEAELPEDPPSDGDTRILAPRYVDIQCANENTKIIQDPTATFSRNAKEGKDGRYKSMLERHDDSDCTDFDRYQALVDYVDQVTGEVGGDKIGFVTHKPRDGDAGFMARLFDDADGDLTFDDHLLWFGNLRGMNKFNGRSHLFILGDPSPNGDAYRSEAMRWMQSTSCQRDNPVTVQDAGYTVWNEQYRLLYRTPHPNQGCGCESEHSDGPWDGNDIHDHVWSRLIRRELYQAIGRARGLQTDSTVFLLSAAHPGQHALEQYDYEVDTRLLQDPTKPLTHVTDIDPWVLEEASGRANNTLQSIQEIADDYDELSWDQVDNFVDEETAVRENKKRRAWELKQAGYSLRKIADSMGSSPASISRWVKDWESDLKSSSSS